MFRKEVHRKNIGSSHMTESEVQKYYRICFLLPGVATPMSKYCHTEVFVILYQFEYVHILYLKYFIPTYIKKITSGYVVCTILKIPPYLYVKKGLCEKIVHTTYKVVYIPPK